MSSPQRGTLKIDWLIVGLYTMFVILGWLNVYAASSKDIDFGSRVFDFSTIYGKQLIWVLSSGLLAAVIIALDSKFLEFISYGVYGLAIIGLIAVMIFGQEVNGAKSWFEVGTVRIQPTEFAKIGTAMAIAKFMSGYNFSIDSFQQRLIAIAIILLPALLIIKQHDTGSALVFSSFLLVFFREGMSPVYLIVIAALAVLSIMSLTLNPWIVIGITSSIVIILWFFFSTRKYTVFYLFIAIFLSAFSLSVDYLMNNVLEKHQRDRILVLINPNSDPLGTGWNITQSQIAIGSGGFWGKGFLNGTQTKFDFVPEQHTDFIFCTIGEEHGWIGSTFILICFFIFLSSFLL
ncbi:MAG: rod shape-determining protein RodA [Bacteroidia bacterium]|nr:rod shape-determining protein RodA [Bacteroidia bacterium]